MAMNRTIPLLTLVLGAICSSTTAADPEPRGPFSERGYYIERRSGFAA